MVKVGDRMVDGLSTKGIERVKGRENERGERGERGSDTCIYRKLFRRPAW